MKLVVKLVPAQHCFVNLPAPLIDRILSQPLEGRVLVQLQWDSHDLVLAWSGASSHDPYTIDLPAELGACYHLESGVEVEVSLVKPSSLYEAVRVMVEPVTVEDWEMLDLNSGMIEAQMMNQVATVKANTVIPVWVNSSTSIRINIKETVPNGAVKLAEGSEVIVSPKPRFNPSSLPNEVSDGTQDEGETNSSSPRQPKPRKAILRLQHYMSNNASTHLLCDRSTMKKLNWSDGMLVAVLSLAPTQQATTRLNHSLHSSFSPSSSGSTSTSSSVIAPALLPSSSSSGTASSMPPLFLRVFGSGSVRPNHAIVHVNTASQLNLHQYSRFLVKPQPTQVLKTARQLERILLQPIHWSTTASKSPSDSQKAIERPNMTILREQLTKWMSSNTGRAPRKDAQPFEPSQQRSSVPITNGTLITLGGHHYIAYANIVPTSALQIRESDGETTRTVLADMSSDMTSNGTMASATQAVASMIPNLPGMAALQQLDQLREASHRVMQAKTEGKLRMTQEAAQAVSAQKASTDLFLIDSDASFSDDTVELGDVVPFPSAWTFPLDYLLLLSSSPKQHSNQSIRTVTQSTTNTGISAHSRASSTGALSATPTPAEMEHSNPSTLSHMLKFQPSPFYGIPTLTQLSLLFDLNDIGGLGPELDIAKDSLHTCLGRRLMKEQLGLRSGGIVLLTGQHGSGKSMALHALGRYTSLLSSGLLSCPLFVSCSEFSGMKVGKIIESLTVVFQDAVFCQPSTIMLDDLDILLPSEKNDAPQASAAKAHHAQILSAILNFLDNIIDNGHQIAVIATSQSTSALHSDLQHPAYLLKHLHFNAPNMKSRVAILQRILSRKGVLLCADHGDALDEMSPQGYSELSRVGLRTEGYMGADLEQLVDRAIHAASVRLIESSETRDLSVWMLGRDASQTPNARIHTSNSSSLIASVPPTAHSAQANWRGSSNGIPEDASSEHEQLTDYSSDGFGSSHGINAPSSRRPRVTAPGLVEAQEGFVPSALRGAALSNSSSTTTWDDVGGLEELKTNLRQTIEWPTKYGFLFKNSPIRHRSGILLYGPSGCGKTLMACAIAKECGLNFISVKGPELLNKYIGQSEQSVRDTFARATAASPCVLFFDEFDSIAPRRGHDNTGVTDRVVNQFLTELDGVEGLEGVYVLAATSRPDLIDPALLRPGRLDKSYYIGYPDESERESILKAITRNTSLAPDVSLSSIASWAQHCTGADLKALIYNAQLEAIHEKLDETKSSIKQQNGGTSGDGSLNSFFSARNLLVLKHDDLRSPSSAPTGYQANGPQSSSSSSLSLASKDSIVKKLEAVQRSLEDERISSGLVDKSSISSSDTNDGVTITMAHLKKAFAQLTPSASPSERKRNEQLYANFMSSRGTDFADANAARVAQKSTLA